MCSVADGQTAPDIVGIAKCGCLGKWPQNIERDLNRMMRRKFNLKVSPVQIKVPDIGKIAVLLPHEMWAFMWHEYPETARQRFLGGPDDLSTFWSKTMASDCNAEWLSCHPCIEMLHACPHLMVPLRLWGDDAPMGKHGREVRVMSWCSCLCRLESMSAKIAMYMGNAEGFTRAAEDAVIRVGAWSLNLMATDVFPHCDWNGNEWPKNSDRARRAGTSLTGTGHRGIYVETCGDWKWTKQVLNLQQSAQHNEVCIHCKAMKTNGALNYANCAVDAPWAQPENRRSFAEYISEQLALQGKLPALTSVLGYHSGTVADDLLHDDLLGVRQHLTGSAMLELAARGIWGQFPEIGRWRERLAFQLDVAYDKFKLFVKNNKLEASQPRFKPCTLSVSTQTCWPKLKSKGHNCAIVSIFLMKEAEQASDAQAHLYHSRVLLTCLTGFVRIWAICKHASTWMTPRECQKLSSARCMALQSYNILSDSCLAQGLYRYEVVPKLHKLDESLRRACLSGRNPMSIWTMSDEDWIGKIAALGCSCHANSLATRCIERFLIHWFNELEK